MKYFYTTLIDIRKKRKLFFLLFLLVLTFTIANNYFFYSFVGKSGHKDVEQLELILTEDLKYFRKNKISDKKYREHTKVIVEQFSKKAQYNKSITLNYQNARKKNGEFKKGYEQWKKEKAYDKVVQTTIDITIPKLNSNEDLKYIASFKELHLLEKDFLLSVYKSMTLSIPDLLFNDMPKIGFIGIIKKWWGSYRYRSHNPIIFSIVLVILLFRIRSYQIELYKELNTKSTELNEKKTELEKKQDEIDEKQDEIDEKQDEIDEKKTELEKKKGELEKKQDEIKKLEKIISKDQNKDIQRIISCVKNKELKELELLLKTGVFIDTKDSEGMTALMHYFLENNADKDQREVIKILLDNGANINEKNNVGMTTLMLCSMRGRNTSVQVLIDNGADTAVKQEVTAADIATPSIRELINKTKNNYPQELVKLLSNFTTEPMKHAAHDWKLAELDGLTTFDEVMAAVKKQFYVIEKELLELSPKLHRKIQLFLFSTDIDTNDNWFNNGEISLNIGWANLDGIKEHCDNGKNAFDFQLKESIIVDGSELNTFGEVINVFKQEIEMRIDFNNLEEVFSNENKKLGKGRNRIFKLDLTDSKLQRQFYTDTQSFSFAISKIFAEIKKREKYPNIEVSTREFGDRSLEIRIIQIDSKVDKNSKTLRDETNSGDFADIKESLENLCDWSVESVCEDGNFRINYLHSNNIEIVENVKTEIKGFTHILRFYR